ncbi:MAG: hypothetical protein JST62_02295 [Bacteroidetes bacterium]|nr:hypothetical protein [Bacteroidota bacterium]
MKKIIGLSFLTAGFFLHAQNIGNSPYAAFGLGETQYDKNVEISAMGGISTAYISDINNSFNFENPANNKNLELTSFKLEAINENNFFKSNYNNSDITKHSTYLSNISLAFPLSQKVKFGIGYQPYSSKRYNMVISNTLSDGTIQAQSFRGEGTLNTLKAAVSYTIIPEFSLGLRANYYFGNLFDINELTYSNAELINGYETKTIVKNFNFTLGANYQKTFWNDRKLTIGATTTLGNTNDMKSEYLNSTYFYNSKGDKSYESIIEQKVDQSKNLIPMEMSLGAGYGHANKWFVGSQMDFKKGEQILFYGKPFAYQDSYRFAAGGWILPNYNNFRNYLSRVIYRFGAYYEKGNLRINDKNINSFAITAGASLPFKNNSINKMSSIDLGLEIGKRGTVQNELVSQTFVNLKIGINFADKWFGKKLYY